MRKFNCRTLKELYDGMEEVSIPTQPFKFRVTEKSRTSDLCATRCLSCRNFDRLAATVGVGTGDFTDKASKKRARLSNQFEKDKEIEIPGDNISCISRSDSTTLTIGNHNDDTHRQNVSCTLASTDRFPAFEKDVNERLICLFVASAPYDKANGNYYDVQNFAEEPPLAGVILPNRSDQSDISSLKHIYDCAITPKGEPSECSGEQVESSPVRAATYGLSGQIDGVYNYATLGKVDPHLNCEDPAVETEIDSSYKKYLRKSVAIIENTSMQESWQSQPVHCSGVSALTDDEVRVCDTCGDVGREELLAICNKCTDGAEHIYCMRVKLDKVPEGDWICEECMQKTDTEKAVQDKVEEAARISKGHLECQKSRSSLKLNFRSSSAGRSGMNGVSSTSQLSARRHAAPLEAQSEKKARAGGMIAVPPRSTQPCNNSLPPIDISSKNLKKGKMKSAKCVSSVPQLSCNSQEKAKVPLACGDETPASILEAELHKKTRSLEKKVVSPKGSRPRKHSLLSMKPPLKNLEEAKLEAASSGTSVKRSSNDTLGNAELPSTFGDKSPKLGARTGMSRDKSFLLKSGSNAMDLKLKGQLERSGFLQKQKVSRNVTYDDYKKGKDSRVMSKSLSINSVSSNKSNAIGSEVLLANDSPPEALKKLSYAKEAKTAKRNEISDLHVPAICISATEAGVISLKGEKETKSCDETLISGSNCHKLDTVRSCGQLNYKLKPTGGTAHKDLNCLSEEKKNSSPKAERPKEDATLMKIHTSHTDLAMDDMFVGRNLLPYEAAIHSQGSVIPKPDYIWLGKFLMHSSERLASFCDGIQAHLSTCVSPKVLEVVDKLPEIIVLEELPRLKMWPSQFIESHATEENIALYFFAKDLASYRTYYRRLLEHMTKNDLALIGNLDGVELLIFPSNVLPENSQRWNKLLFLWGVFRGRKVNNSVNKQITNSQKQENRDSERRWTWDLNVYPQDEEDVARVDAGDKCWSINSGLSEINEFDNTGERSTGGRILLGGNGCSSGFSDPREAVDKGGNRSKSEVLDLGLSLWPKSATPSDEVGPSVGVVDDKTNRKVHGKLLMDDENNGDNGEPSGLLSLSLASPSSDEENLDLLERQAVDILVSLSKGSKNI